MNVVLCVATNRGLQFLDLFIELSRGCNNNISVVSFREEPFEPAYFDEIRTLCGEHGLPFYESKALDSRKCEEIWNKQPIDLLIAICWRYLIPSSIYSVPSVGSFVIHDSLLPSYRGFSPSIWAIRNGERSTGATMFRMAEEVDSGDIVAQREVPIGDDDDVASIRAKVTRVYLEILKERFAVLMSGDISCTPQNHERATYCCKINPEDNLIDWTKSAEEVHNLIRSVTKPYTGAFSYMGSEKITIWQSKVCEQVEHYVGGIPGKILKINRDRSVTVLSSDGYLEVLSIEYRGKTVRPGDILKFGATLKSVPT